MEVIYRIHKTKDYSVISNYHLKDKRMSCKAKGLLTTMLSLPDDWNFSAKGLAELSSDGKDSIGSALMELEENGYLVRSQGRSDGQFSGYQYDIYETPQSAENPLTENPLTENPPQLNTKESNTKEIVYPLAEIRSYCNSKKVNADAFIQYYSSRNWMIGNEPIRDWRLVVDGWSKRNKNQFTNFSSSRTDTDWKEIERKLLEK